jgi:hypothetical protein
VDKTIAQVGSVGVDDGPDVAAPCVVGVGGLDLTVVHMACRQQVRDAQNNKHY